MAEENTTHDYATITNHDDMSVMRVLLHTVKGLSPVSVTPALEMAMDDSPAQVAEAFEFE